MKEHLVHMSSVRPEGLDRDAAKWVIAELDRLTAERDAALRTIEILEANARIQATILANTGRERDALKLALTSGVSDAEQGGGR